MYDREQKKTKDTQGYGKTKKTAPRGQNITRTERQTRRTDKW